MNVVIIFSKNYDDDKKITIMLKNNDKATIALYGVTFSSTTDLEHYLITKSIII